jgi:phosphatidylglycerol:prolipoprotein diacylglycerol transferase
MPFLIDQFGIHLGPLYLRFYGLILVTGAFLGGYLASLEAKRKGYNPEQIWDGMLWVLIGGIVGARLWHIFTPPPSMVAQGLTTAAYLNLTNVTNVTVPLINQTIPIPRAFAVWEGGLGIPGAVAGGMLAMYLYTRSLKASFTDWADFVAPALALGQAIGRWGNFVNQELYGQPTTLPWGITIDLFPGQKFHPLFLYESLGNLAICLALLYLARRYADRLKSGDLFLFYLLMYPALRFFLEFIRLDSSQIFKLNANQTLMAIVFVIALGLLLSRHNARANRAARRARLSEAESATPEPGAPTAEPTVIEAASTPEQSSE